MDKVTKSALRYALIAAALGAGAAQAQQPVDQTWCRSGTISVLAKEEKMIMWALDHRGVAQASDPSDPLNGATQRCIGVVAVIDGKSSGNGWCKINDPKSSDWWVVDWTATDKPGHGTWSYRYGSGKYKGVTGGGTYEPVGQTRPIEPGTYQNCARVKGTMKLPG